MGTYSEDVRSFYNEDARRYDEEHETAYYRHVRHFERKFLAELRDPILDIGSGTGYLLRGREFVALDIAEEMLKRNPGIAVLGSSEHLPFPDESFNSVSSLLISLAFSNIGKSFREIWRVLKPGGKAVVTLPVGGKSHFRHRGTKIRFNLVSHDYVPEGFRLLRRKYLFHFLKPKWRTFRAPLYDRLMLAAEKILKTEKGETVVMLLQKITP